MKDREREDLLQQYEEWNMQAQGYVCIDKMSTAGVRVVEYKKPEQLSWQELKILGLATREEAALSPEDLIFAKKTAKDIKIELLRLGILGS